MNENRHSATQWLKYLMYAGIALALNYLRVYSLLGFLSGWILIGINVVVLYLLFVLAEYNSRYRKAGILYLVSKISVLIGIPLLSLVGLVFGTVAQYQEFHGHSELVAARDSKLAGKWNSLFWLQFVGSLVLGGLIGVVVSTLAILSGLETESTNTIINAASNGFTLLMQILYLVYLNRTIKALETEFVVE